MFWTLHRLLARVLPPKSPIVLRGPEEAYTVLVTADLLACLHADGERQELAWTEIDQIWIETNDEGPMLPDVFWVCWSGARKVRFPQGARGEAAAMDRAMKLPGFNLEAFGAAMRCTDNAVFVVWRRDWLIG